MNVQIGHPCIDSIFQYGFADPSILKDFLNVVLKFVGAQAIEEISYLSRTMPPFDPQSKTGYTFTVDVRCRTKSGRHFLIEMQNDFRGDYHMKALVEHSRMLSRLDTDQTAGDRFKRTAKNGTDRNKFWKGVEGIYTIIMTNKSFPSSKLKSYYSGETVMEPFLVNPYELRHVEQLDRHLGDIPNQVVFLMLSNLNPQHTGQVLTPVERWAHVFRDPALRSGVAKIPKTKEIKNVDALAGDVKSIRAFIDRLNVTKLPIHVKECYELAVNYHNGALADIEEKATEKGLKLGQEKGLKLGQEIGLKLGQEKSLKYVAQRMLIAGKTISEIVDLTGLSFQIVESLLLLLPKSQGNTV